MTKTNGTTGLAGNELTEILTFNKQRVRCGKSPLGYGFTHFATVPLRAGETVVRGYGKVIDHQTSHFSVQMGVQIHFLPNKWTGRYWNHSCDPNCHVITGSDGFPHLIASRDISEGEEITYAYFMTEYEWSRTANENDVVCHCGKPNCRGKIPAFRNLSTKEQKFYISKGMVSNYLKNPT